MHLESYKLIYSNSFTGFSFISEGRKGRIKKIIQFQKLASPDFYNLAFGDEDTQTKQINDLIATDNGDMKKVLATVARAVYVFTDENPQSWIYIEGSTPARTRLYQIGINRFFDLLTDDFEIYGETGSKWFVYERKDRYSAFITRRKKLYF